MKIGLITDSIRDQATGIGFYTKDIITQLLELDKSNEYHFLDFMETEFNKDNLTFLNNPFPYFKTYLWHNYIPLTTHLLDLDLIINFSACPHLLPFKQKEIFFVYDISWYLYPEYHPKSRVLFYKFMFKQCLMNSSHIVVDSFSTKNDLIKFFNIPDDKMSVIYPTFADKTKNVNSIKYPIDSPYILFIGTLEPRKNILSIIHAFNQLKQSKKVKHKLIICGKKGWLYESIFELIKTLHLENDIIYLGYISNEEKKYLYQHADFFVYPSFYEGFGIPVLEAMRYGCPVITSTVSSLPEVAGKAALLVTPDSTEQLTIAMDQLIKDKTLREKIAAEGYRQIKNLSNKKQIQEILKLISV